MTAYRWTHSKVAATITWGPLLPGSHPNAPTVKKVELPGGSLVNLDELIAVGAVEPAPVEIPMHVLDAAVKASCQAWGYDTREALRRILIAAKEAES